MQQVRPGHRLDAWGTPLAGARPVYHLFHALEAACAGERATTRVMPIDWSAFTPGPAAVGGVVIGLAVALLGLVNDPGESALLSADTSRRERAMSVAPLIHRWIFCLAARLFAGSPTPSVTIRGHGVCEVSRCHRGWPLLVLVGAKWPTA